MAAATHQMQRAQGSQYVSEPEDLRMTHHVALLDVCTLRQQQLHAGQVTCGMASVMLREHHEERSCCRRSAERDSVHTVREPSRLAPLPAASRSGGSPQWSDSFSGAPCMQTGTPVCMCCEHGGMLAPHTPEPALMGNMMFPELIGHDQLHCSIQPEHCRRTSRMCSWTQSCMPSTQSRQMLDFSGMNFPVCTNRSGCQSDVACCGRHACWCITSLLPSRGAHDEVERHGSLVRSNAAGRQIVRGCAALLVERPCRSDRGSSPSPALQRSMRLPACQGASSGYGSEHEGRGRPACTRTGSSQHHA